MESASSSTNSTTQSTPSSTHCQNGSHSCNQQMPPFQHPLFSLIRELGRGSFGGFPMMSSMFGAPRNCCSSSCCEGKREGCDCSNSTGKCCNGECKCEHKCCGEEGIPDSIPAEVVLSHLSRIMEMTNQPCLADKPEVVTALKQLKEKLEELAKPGTPIPIKSIIEAGGNVLPILFEKVIKPMIGSFCGTFGEGCEFQQNPTSCGCQGMKFICDCCDSPIVGVRYHCGSCETSYDLCEGCYCNKDLLHNPEHPFEQINP